MILSRVGVFPIGYMVAAKGSYAAIGAVVALLLRRPYQRILRSEPSLVRLIVVGIVASYLAALLWTVVANFTTHAWVDPLFRTDGRVVPITARTLTSGSLYNAFIMLAWSLLYFGITWQQALVAERERVLRAEALAHESRLESLRYQLNPHFLFNALNGVSALVLEQRTDQAAEMLARLAAFLRMTLEEGRAAEITLDDELLFVRAYLGIEQARFEDRLQVSFDIAPEARRAMVPTLLLQPLVENAVRHAVSVRVHGAVIDVAATVSEGELRLSITDHWRDEVSPPGAAGDEGSGSFGIGLTNTRERLAVAYGDRASLHFAHISDGACVTIRMPFRREQQTHVP